MDFWLAESEKCNFHFPYKPMTCITSDWLMHPSMGAMMPFYEGIIL